MNYLMDPNGRPNNLYQYLKMELAQNMLPQQKTEIIQSGITAISEYAKQTRTVIDIDTMLLIRFDDYFDLYKNIPKYIVERFRDVNEINIHIHLLRRQIREDWDMEFEEGPPEDGIYINSGDTLISPETGERYECEDNGEWRYCKELDELISVLEALKHFQNSLYELGQSGVYEKYQIYIDQVDVVYYNGTVESICSIDCFVDEFLSGLRYRYDFYNWREYYV